MNMISKLSFTAFFAALFAVSLAGPAAAQNYVGLSGGLMAYEDTDADLDSQGFTVFAGGQFNVFAAVEFSYTSIANVEANTQNNQASVLALSGLLRSPGEGFEPFLRLGLARGDAKITGGTENYNETKEGLIFGFGADIPLNYNTAIRIEYVETDMDGAKSDRLSAGAVYRF